MLVGCAAEAEQSIRVSRDRTLLQVQIVKTEEKRIVRLNADSGREMLEFSLAGDQALFDGLDPLDLLGQPINGHFDTGDALLQFDGFRDLAGDVAGLINAGAPPSPHAALL